MNSIILCWQKLKENFLENEIEKSALVKFGNLIAFWNQSLHKWGKKSTLKHIGFSLFQF